MTAPVGPREVADSWWRCVTSDNWGTAVDFTQETWAYEIRQKARDPVEALRTRLEALGHVTVVRVGEPEPSSRLGSVVVDVPVTIQYQDRKHGPVRTTKVWSRLVRESGPYQPSETGTWGVNPNSIMRKSVGPTKETGA